MKSFDEMFADLDLSGPSQDYTQDFNASTIFQDTRFLNDVRKFFEAKGETFDNDQDMIARFYNDRTWGNLNTLGMAEDLNDAYNGAPEQRERLKRLQFVYDNMPSFYEDGGAVDQVGAWETTKSIGGALLADPLNLLGGAGAWGKAAKAGAQGASKGRAIWEGVKAGAKTEALIGAPVEAAFDAGLQNRDIELGLQDEFSKTQMALSGAAGGLFSGAMGALSGLAVSIFSRKNVKLGQEVYQKMLDDGITPDYIERMSDTQLDQVLDNYRTDSSAAIGDVKSSMEAEQLQEAQRAEQAAQAPAQPEAFQPDPDLQQVLDKLIDIRDSIEPGQDGYSEVITNIANVRRVIRETNTLDVRNKAVEDQYKSDPYNSRANRNEYEYAKQEDFVARLKRLTASEDFDGLDSLLKKEEAQRTEAETQAAAQSEAGDPQTPDSPITPAPDQTAGQTVAQKPAASTGTTPEPKPDAGANRTETPDSVQNAKSVPDSVQNAQPVHEATVDPKVQKAITTLQTQWEELMDEPLDTTGLDLNDKDSVINFVESAKTNLQQAKAQQKQIKADPKTRPVIGPKARVYLKTKLGMTDEAIDRHKRPKVLLTKLAEHRGLTLPKAAKDMSRDQLSRVAELSPKQMKAWQQDVNTWADAVTEHTPSGQAELRQQIWRAIYDANHRGDDTDTFVDISYMAGFRNQPKVKQSGRGAIDENALKARAKDAEAKREAQAYADEQAEAWKGQRARNIGGGLFVEPKYSKNLHSGSHLTKQGIPRGIDSARLLASDHSTVHDGLFVPFQSVSKTSVVDGKPLTHGEIGYFNPVDGKVYRNKASYFEDLYEQTLKSDQPLTLSGAYEVIRRNFTEDIESVRSGQMTAGELLDTYGEADTFNFTNILNHIEETGNGSDLGLSQDKLKVLFRYNRNTRTPDAEYRSDELYHELSIDELERGLDGRKPAQVDPDVARAKEEAMLKAEWEMEYAQVNKGQLSQEAFVDFYGPDLLKKFDFDKFNAWRAKQESGKPTRARTPAHAPARVEPTTQPLDVEEPSASIEAGTPDSPSDAIKQFINGDTGAIKRYVEANQPQTPEPVETPATPTRSLNLPDEDPAPDYKISEGAPASAGDFNQPGPGYRRAIKATDAKGNTYYRVHGAESKGATPEESFTAMLGKSNLTWERGVVESKVTGSRKADNQERAAQSWIADTDQDHPRELNPVQDVKAQAEAEKIGKSTKATPFEELDNIKIKLSLKRHIKALNVAGKFAGRTTPFQKGDTVTAKELVTARIFMGSSQNFKAYRNAKDYQTLLDQYANLVELEQKYVPQGFVQPAEIRADIRADVEDLFKGFAREDVETAYELLSRINNAHGKTPAIHMNSNLSVNGKYTADMQDVLKPNEFQIQLSSKPTEAVPVSHVLMHEVGHWSFENLLTPTERLDFMKWFQSTYYRDGKVDFEKINSDTIYSNLAKGDANRTGADQFYAPGELFANQFHLWFARKLKGEGTINVERMEGLWSRVVDYVKEVFSAIFHGKPVRPDLEPIFARIAPDPDALSDAAKIVKANPEARVIERAADVTTEEVEALTKGTARHSHRRLVELEDLTTQVSDNLDPTMRTVADHEPLEELANFFNSVSAPKNLMAHLRTQDQQRYSSGAFSVLSPLHTEMQGAAHQILRLAKRIRKASADSADEIEFIDTQDINIREIDYDGLYKLYEEGEPNPAHGLPSPPLKDLIPKVQKMLRWDFYAGSGIAVADDTLISGTQFKNKTQYAAEVLDKVYDKARKQYVDRNTLDDNVVEAAITEAKTGKRRPDTSGKDTGTSVKKATLDELRTIVIENKGTGKAQDAAKEIIRKLKATDIPIKNVPKKIRSDLFPMKQDQLVSTLRTAVDSADSDTIDQIVYRLYIKSQGKKMKGHQSRGGDEFTLFTPKDARIREAITIEQDAFKGISPDADIPANAPAHVRQMLSFMTHRDPEIQSVLRTMAFRMINLLGKATKGDLASNTDVLTMADLYRMIGQTPPANATATFADLSGEAFNQLRKQQRQFAIGLTKGVSDPVDLMHEIGHMTMRTLFDDADKAHMAQLFRESNDPIKQRIIQKYGDRNVDTQVEEWFVEGMANHMAERVAKGDIWAYRTGQGGDKIRLRGRISTMVDRLIEAIAYLTNGLIGNKSIKQYYRRLSFYGDMLAPANPNPYGKRKSVASAYAADYMNARLKDVDDIRVANMKKFARGGEGWDEATDQPVIFWHNASAENSEPFTSGALGNAIYLNRNADIARSQMGDKAMQQALNQHIRKVGLGEREADALLMADDLANIRQQISQTTRNLNNNERPYLKTRLDALMQHESVIESALRDMGIDFTTTLTPVVVRANDLINLRASTLIDTSHPIFEVAESLLPPQQLNTLRQVAQTEQPTGQQFLDLMYQVAPGDDWAQAMQAKGYKGIAYSDTASSVNHDALAMFEPESVKHFDSDDFNPGETGYDAIPHEANINGALMNGAIESDGPMNALGFSSIANGLEKLGVPSKLTDAISNIIRGRITTKEGGEISKFRMPLQIASNANRWRRWNDSFLSDWLAPRDGLGHYERIGQHLGGIVVPIFRDLKKLPDASGKLVSWARASNPFKRYRSQPDSYKRIVKALRRKPGSSAEQALKPQEYAIYNKMRNEFESIADQMKQAGVLMGNIKHNYFPQIWSKEHLEKDPDKFMDAMARYFMADAHSGQLDPLTWEQARESAARMYDKLVNDDGMYIPTPGASREAKGDHIDFQRIIRLDDERFKAHLDELEPFLESDLESVVTKYFDTATRRIDFTNKFGVGNHALYDYTNLVQAPNTTSAIADLLSSNRVHTKNIKVPLASNNIGEMEIETTLLRRPFSTHEQALPVAQEAEAIFNRHGKEGARAFLIEKFGNQPSDAHLKRIDAIVNALDVRRNNHRVDATELGKALAVIQSVQHKPMTANDPFNSQAMGFVRTLKAFNNVSLLGYTTLTSFGDPALALIRSGDMKSFAKAMKNFAKDPDYRAAIQNTGVAIENIVHQRMQYLYGGDTTYASQAFFNASLLTPWTNMMREVAGAIGFESIKAEQKRLNRFYKPGLPIDQQPTQYRTAKRFLNRLGLNEFTQPGAPSLDSMDMLNNEQVRGALIRFANESIFAPNPNDVPAWAQTPWGSLIFQFKSFPLMMGRLARYGVEEAGKGNWKPAIMFASVGPGFATASLAAKDIVQSRGGDDGQSVELRSRNILKSMGYDQEIHGNEDDFLGWYYESMLHMGGFGLLANMVNDVAQQTDNGAYGQMRILGTVFGPTVSNVAAKSMNIYSGLTDASDNSNAKERQAAREVIGAVPFAGQNMNLRERFVDAVSGEATGRKKKSQWDNSWGDSSWKKNEWGD